jgi:thiosulfate reductase cytochrome b subunit
LSTPAVHGHARWIRVSHWIVTASTLALAFSGFVILMAHPRLYWGNAGNDLTPALLELPISRNYKHGGYADHAPISDDPAGPISANRTYDIFNENGWGRSLHFLAAWWLVVPGVVYLLIGLGNGHFRSRIVPAAKELAPQLVWREIVDRARLRISPATGSPHYGVLQKTAYAFVIFVAAPVVTATGLAMSPAITGAFPWLLRIWGGYQSARTVHFFAFVALMLFLLVHIAMVVMSGFRRQIRGMTVGG